MAVDPYGRLLYWTCANTNAVNVTRLDNGSAVGVVVKVDGEKPRNIALHPEKGYVKYCNFSHSFFLIYLHTYLVPYVSCPVLFFLVHSKVLIFVKLPYATFEIYCMVYVLLTS